MENRDEATQGLGTSAQGDGTSEPVNEPDTKPEPQGPEGNVAEGK